MKPSKATIKALEILATHERAIHPEFFAMQMWPADEDGHVSRPRRRNWPRMGAAYLSKLSKLGLVKSESHDGYKVTRFWRITEQGRELLRRTDER